MRHLARCNVVQIYHLPGVVCQPILGVASLRSGSSSGALRFCARSAVRRKDRRPEVGGAACKMGRPVWLKEVPVAGLVGG